MIGNSSILNCANYARITLRSDGFRYAGGICGYASTYNIETISISNCTNYGDVGMPVLSGFMMNLGFVGGIVGAFSGGGDTTFNQKMGTMILLNNTNYGNIVAPEAVGGIAGCLDLGSFAKQATISNCVNSGNVTGIQSVGGICGHIHGSTNISNCVNIGIIKGYWFVGGIVGGDDLETDGEQYREKGSMQYCVNSGLIIGNSEVGGIIGICTGEGEVRNCISTGVVSYSKTNTFTGGIAGRVQDGIVINSYYDRQMCLYGGINDADIAGQAEGYLTKKMIGTGLRNKLSDNFWMYPSSGMLYPIVKSVQNEIISLIAASPAYLDDKDTVRYINDFMFYGYDVHLNIRRCFPVNIENNVA
jgi:hypothetical protein